LDQAGRARTIQGTAEVIRIDYNQPPDPPLVGDDAAWAEEFHRAAGLRTTKP
jgi:hypothetical protein